MDKMTDDLSFSDKTENFQSINLELRISRLKNKLLTSPYEIYMTRTYYFTQFCKENEVLDRRSEMP